MDTELLRTFLELQRTRHFGRTADNLFLTQAAVSTRVRQLESLLGAELFVRERNNIRLTSVGERLLPYAEAVVATWQAARQDIAAGKEPQQLLTLAAPQSIWSYFLNAALSDLWSVESHTCVRAQVRSCDSIARQFSSRSLHLALSFSALSQPSVDSQSLGQVPLVLVQKAGVSEPVPIATDWGESLRTAQARALKAPAQLYVDDSAQAERLLLRHGGCCYLPVSQAVPLLQSGALSLQPEAPVLQREVFLLTRTEPVPPEFLAQCRERLVDGWQRLQSECVELSELVTTVEQV